MKFSPLSVPYATGLRRLCSLLALLSASLLIAACSSTGTQDRDPTVGWSAERLYEDARSEISSRNWTAARKRLESIEARYPFGVHAQQALMDMAYVNWRDGEPELALAAIDRFQQQYPNHPGTDYMLYLKGLITFTPPSAMLSRLTQQDPSERDPKGLRESYDSFNTLLQRYPDSRYAADARKRLTWLVETIAQNEIHVARYYFERGAYVAAINRAQTVITDFDGVTAAEPALYIMMQAYDKLGQIEQRDDTKRVLDLNFPNSDIYERGLKRDVDYWNPLNWF